VICGHIKIFVDIFSGEFRSNFIPNFVHVKIFYLVGLMIFDCSQKCHILALIPGLQLLGIVIFDNSVLRANAASAVNTHF
jgi:hypothetical protein